MRRLPIDLDAERQRPADDVSPRDPLREFFAGRAYQRAAARQEASAAARLFTLYRTVPYRSGTSREPVSDHATRPAAVHALRAQAAAYPSQNAEVREDVTSDGTRHVRDGHAHGRMVADYQYDPERGRRLVRDL